VTTVAWSQDKIGGALTCGISNPIPAHGRAQSIGLRRKFFARLRDMKLRFMVPIYEAEVWLVVANGNGIYRERAKMASVFGDPPEPHYSALCSHDGNHRFGLFFTTIAARDLGIVAHEVFHLTHRILEWTGSNFDPAHHEQGALLHGFLFATIARHFGRKV
jgi:hypothetical protein